MPAILTSTFSSSEQQITVFFLRGIILKVHQSYYQILKTDPSMAWQVMWRSIIGACKCVTPENKRTK